MKTFLEDCLRRILLGISERILGSPSKKEYSETFSDKNWDKYAVFFMNNALGEPSEKFLKNRHAECALRYRGAKNPTYYLKGLKIFFF